MELTEKLKVKIIGFYLHYIALFTVNFICIYMQVLVKLLKNQKVVTQRKFTKFLCEIQDRVRCQ